MLKDLAMSLSLANLCFLTTWNELLNSPIRRSNAGLAVLINVAALALIFWIAIRVARRSTGTLPLRLARFFFPLVLLFPIKTCARLVLPGKRFTIELLALLLSILLVALFEVQPWHRMILNVSSVCCLVLFPFCLITFYQAFRTLIPVPDKHSAAPLTSSTSTSPRVLWLVFDEMDQRLTFGNRPATLQLPELDRLRSEGLYAPNAYPPSDSTVVSMPALIIGKLLSNAELVNQSKLVITPADSGEPADFNGHTNLFTRAEDAGYGTALVGWHIPYCSLIGENVSSCTWVDHEESTLVESLTKQAEALGGAVPLASDFVIAHQMETQNRQKRRKQYQDYSSILEAAKKVTVDPDIRLILVHWPVPHLPGIYNRAADSFELTVESGYLDNLRLVDRTVGELRRDLAGANLWDDTVLIVTSDHWLRSFWKTMGPDPEDRIIPGDPDQRVPFLIKLAREEKAVTYDASFNTVLTHDMVLALLRGEISNSDSVLSWLDEHRSVSQSPYRFNP
jgi:hypothetical protein